MFGFFGKVLSTETMIVFFIDLLEKGRGDLVWKKKL
jgi:hypothetical protein